MSGELKKKSVCGGGGENTPTANTVFIFTLQGKMSENKNVMIVTVILCKRCQI